LWRSGSIRAAPSLYPRVPFPPVDPAQVGQREGERHVTENLVDWETIDTGMTVSVRDIEFNGKQVAVVGRDRSIATPANGIDWMFPLDMDPRSNMRHLACHDGTYLAAAANSVVYTSNDTEARIPVFDIPEEHQSAGLERFLGAYTLITNRGPARIPWPDRRFDLRGNMGARPPLDLAHTAGPGDHAGPHGYFLVLEEAFSVHRRTLFPGAPRGGISA
jgi:hypothetical protein